MKKITFLFITLFTITGFSQTFNFTNSDDGWSSLAGFNSTLQGSYMSLITKDNTIDGSLKNPTVKTTTAGVDTSVNKFVGITIRNNSTSGPNYLRISFPRTGGRVYKNLNITTGDTDFVTYWVDLTNENWTGIMDDIQLHFKSEGNTDYFLPNPQATIDVDKIEFVAFIPTTLKESFTFSIDGNTEGFEATNGSVSGPNGGVLTFIPEALKFARIDQLLYHANATDNKTVTIVLKNNSPVNNQLRFIHSGGTITQLMSVSDADYKTYKFDLSEVAEWTGNQKISIGIGISTGNDVGKAADAGNVEFKSIVIDNSVVLSNESFEKSGFTIFPNPANDQITISAINSFAKVILYNVLGKKVLESSNNSNILDVSSLNSGIYLVKIQDNKNNVSNQKLIIK